MIGKIEEKYQKMENVLESDNIFYEVGF